MSFALGKSRHSVERNLRYKIALRCMTNMLWAGGVLTLSHFDTTPSVIDGDSFGMGTKMALLPDGPFELAICLVKMPDRASTSNVPHS